jgi:FtsH-binding integral membrane protein
MGWTAAVFFGLAALAVVLARECPAWTGFFGWAACILCIGGIGTLLVRDNRIDKGGWR